MQVVERELHTDLTIGVRIADRFDLVRRVGNGSFGTVFECTDLQQGKQCALKFEWGTLVNQLNGEAGTNPARVCAPPESLSSQQ